MKIYLMSFTSNRFQVILNHLKPSIKRTSTNEYIYTLDNKIFSDAERLFYEHNGYLIVRNMIPNQQIDLYKQRFLDFCNKKIDNGHMLLMKDKSLMKTEVKGEFLINKIQDIMWDETFSTYVTNPKLLDYVECFTGPNIMMIHSMLINKPPDSGKLTSIHPTHQDLYYFPFRPVNRIVGAWTAMERVTKNNGCLYVLPGTHKITLQPHGYPENDVNKAYHGTKGFELIPHTYLEMDKGDTVFLHPLLLHGSGPNLSKGFRKCISCHYASSDCYYIDVTGTVQETAAKEITEMFEKSRGWTMDYKDTWRLRQRLVRGSYGTL